MLPLSAPAERQTQHKHALLEQHDMKAISVFFVLP